MTIQLDMYQTIAVAVVVLMLGNFLKHRIAILERFCIPAPVIGGVIFAIFTCICYVTGIAEFSFDDILKEVCMVFFFTSVGFQANLKIFDHFPDPYNRADHMPELPCSRSVQSITDQSFGWTLYRFYPYDRWSWYRWCIWTCS